MSTNGDTEVDSGWRMPVGVVMESQPAKRGQWTWTNWRAIEVLAGDALAAEAGETVLGDDGVDQRVLYTGFSLELFKDGGRDYWYNLVSDAPALYVICECDEDDPERLTPVQVTATPDEAAAHLETDDPVFSVPMPVVVHEWLERYVVNHYVPEKLKKRKRQ